MLTDPWTVLGVSDAATDEEIRVAYKRKAKELHPDAGGSTEDFQILQQAYEVLSGIGDPRAWSTSATSKPSPDDAENAWSDFVNSTTASSPPASDFSAVWSNSRPWSSHLAALRSWWRVVAFLFLALWVLPLITTKSEQVLSLFLIIGCVAVAYNVRRFKKFR